jgi:hypothetical protein
MYIMELEFIKFLLYLVPSHVEHTTAGKNFSALKTDVMLHRRDIIPHGAVLMSLSSNILSQWRLCDLECPDEHPNVTGINFMNETLGILMYVKWVPCLTASRVLGLLTEEIVSR